jgi:hypothetical protein
VARSRAVVGGLHALALDRAEGDTTSRRQGDPPTSKSIRRRHRNLPTLEKERNRARPC